MLQIAQGNLLAANVEALVNTVNTVGVMGKGIALQFKRAFPENFRAYKKACDAGDVEAGKMFIFATGQVTNPKYIVNFPTKKHWRAKSKLDDIKAGLVALIKEVRERNITSVAVPPLGCGYGGLRWGDVRPLIVNAFEAVPEVTVLLFEPAGAPDAKTMPNATKRPEMTRARALFLKLMERYTEPGYPLTALELQKLAYFLQASGEPLKLRFQAHHYGPYADNLNFVLQLLEGHFISGYGDDGRKPDTELQLLPGATEIASEFLQTDDSATQRLAEVARIIEGFETPYGMELLATAHWLATQVENKIDNADAAIAAVRAWSQRKRDMFKDDHIRVAWEHLTEVGALKQAEMN